MIPCRTHKGRAARLLLSLSLLTASRDPNTFAQPVMPPGIVRSEFIFTNAPFASCHASTIAETKGYLVAAWFGGTGEGHKDVGIWLSQFEGGKWTPPKEVANGRQADGSQEPCWNPVLFQPRNGSLLLFFKAGPNPRKWWGMLMTSEDGGLSWTTPRRLPDGVLGPIKNKPVELAGGVILCPSSTEHDGWRIHFERTSDRGETWSTTGPISEPRNISAIQPSILVHPGERLQALCRTRQSKIFETWSENHGETWGNLTATALPNPNSGIDAVTIRDGRHVLVYNHTTRDRSPLNVALSQDGRDWQAALVLEKDPGEYSYPAVIQTSDGMVHITYTWKRLRVKHVLIDPTRLTSRAMTRGRWPE